MGNGKRRLLLVEDDPADRNLVDRALKAAGISVDLVLAESSAEALQHLAPSLPREHRTLVLLDLNLVASDGREVLRWLRQEGLLDLYPVVVFTNSRSDRDIAECYALGAKSYLRKPSDFRQLVETLRLTTTYWFEAVQLPSKRSV